MPSVPSPDDPRRPEKIRRYKAPEQTESTGISEHVNAMGMVFSLVGLLLRVRHRLYFSTRGGEFVKSL